MIIKVIKYHLLSNCCDFFIKYLSNIRNIFQYHNIFKCICIIYFLYHKQDDYLTYIMFIKYFKTLEIADMTKVSLYL